MWVPVGLAVLVSLIVVPVATGDDITINRFRSESSEAWKKLKAGILQGFEVEVTYTWGDLTDKGIDPKSPRGGCSCCKHCISKGNELIQTTYLEGIRKGLRIEAVNDSYAFDLLKHESKDRSWDLTTLNRDSASRKTDRHGVLLGNTGAFEGIMIEGDWLDDLLGSAGFEILSCESVTSENAGREFRITFRCQHAVDRANTIVGGAIWFLPERFWVLSRYDVEIKSRTKGHGRAAFKYQDLDGYPFLKERVMDYKFDGDAPIRYHDEYGTVCRSNAPASAFRLSAFGIPEPAALEATKNPAPRWPWVAVSIAGIVLCSSALVLRKYAKRRAD